MRVIIGASAPTATFTNEVGIGSSSQLVFVIDVTSLVISSTVTLLQNAIVLELSGTSGLSEFDFAGMEFLILFIFSTKKSTNKLHNSDADLLDQDGRGVVLDFPSSKWTTENSCLVFPRFSAIGRKEGRKELVYSI